MSRKIAVVGLGYVGLPLAVALARAHTVVGFDIFAARVDELKCGIDRNGELPAEELQQPNLLFTSEQSDLGEASLYIVTVPTPVDDAHVPDLSPLRDSSDAVGRYLKRGDIVVFESTVYPGCTEEVCLPRLEAASGLRAPADFTVGYSPERINPGDREHTISTMIKIVAAQTPETLAVLTEVYGQVNGGRIHQAPNIKTAEAAKVIENTQRDLNIALMNELSMLFHRLEIDTQDVLAAAGTKWNFLKFQPGLVGGHCIPVDPYYLTHKAEMLGYHPQIILAGRRINDQMARYVSYEILRMLAKLGLSAKECSILVLGATFKPDVRDLRNSQVFELVAQLSQFSKTVAVYDPVPDQAALRKTGLQVVDSPQTQVYEVVVLAVNHSEFGVGSVSAVQEMLNGSPAQIVVDLTGGLSREGSGHTYFWQL
ncbi:MAG: nucleotide sugar dehydrogenase [Candidatus Eremiobacteraeota bacterium]|nr:nucleotide sugar dehydrogenase [Candidatus Eremiobacteraeota bacterium]